MPRIFAAALVLTTTSALGPQCLTRRQLPGCAMVTFLPRAASANDEEDIGKLRSGLVAIDELLRDWDAKTLNCNYAEVNRELLSKKKELLEEASKNALMSKTAIKTICKRDPEYVRLVLGFDSEVQKKSSVPTMFAEKRPEEQIVSTLVGADSIIKRCLALADDTDTYVAAEEDWLQAIAAADSATYAARRDFSSVVIASDDDNNTSLNDARRATAKARDALAIIVQELSPPPR